MENRRSAGRRPNYGSTHYTLHGFQYNLQDLTFLRYFGGR